MTNGATIWLAMLMLAPGALAGDATGFAPGYPSWGTVTFGPEVVPETFLLAAFANQPAAPPGSVAFFRLDVALDKTQSLQVRTFGLPSGSYQLALGGFDAMPLGKFDVASDGLGTLAPEAPSPDGFLTWFAHSDFLRVLQGDQLLFSIQLKSSSAGSKNASPESMVNGARLIAVGDDLDARGRMLFTANGGNGTADLLLERLDPGPYVVEVDGASVSFVVAGPGGTARLQLSSPLKPGTGQGILGWQGTVVRLRNAAAQIVLEAQMPFDPYLKLDRPPGRQKFRDVGDGAADGLSVDFIKADWASNDGLKSGWISWQRDASGAGTITVSVAPAKPDPFSTYELFEGETLVGSFGPIADSGDPLQATFAAGPELDLRGQRVEVRDGGQAPLALVFPQSVPAGLRSYHKGVRKPHHIHLDLLNPGLDLDATGLVDWREHAGSQQLQLVVRDLPAGGYDVVLDDVVVAPGALVVAADGGDAQALFSTNELPGSLALDFAVHGQLSIRAAGSDTVDLQQSLDP